jgi:hypothetical protein
MSSSAPAVPRWYWVAASLAVVWMLIGATGLVMRRRWAVAMLGLSLVAVIVQFGYTFLLMDAIAKVGAALALPLPIVIVVAGVLSLWLGQVAAKRGWLT